VPAKIRAQQRPLSRARKTATRFSKRNPLYTVLIVLLAIGLIALASVTLFVSQPPLSIAVLPFTSLGDASFADGLVGEITTKLENVHQFDKVISQTSVMQYKPGSGRTAPQIAAELHVTYLLEGSVQRIGDHIRVQAQLIDARADKHLWSQQYDNDAGNTFQIQSEICEDIVRRLNLRLSPGEKGQLELAKRTSVPAQDNYTRAGALITSAVFSARAREELEQATALLDRATRDAPDFARAYYQLAHAHDQLYHRFDGTPERLRKAEEAIMALRNLAPDSPETHLARAKHLYWALGDYDSAMDELAIAQPFLPNESMIPALQAYIRRRRSDWNGSYADFARARELDPRNPFLLQQLAINYFNQRRFAEMTQVLEQAIRFAPEDPVLRAQRAAVEMEWHADPKPLHDFIASVVANGSSHAASIADQWLDLAFRERDARAASEAVALLGNDACAYENIPLPRSWCEGRVASLAHDADSAQKYYAECHAAGERLVATQPNFGGAWCVLALADAALGHADAAIEEGKHAAELIPVEKDALNGPVVLGYLAMIYAWSDKPDLALKQLEHAVSVPSYWSYGNLALHPDWDALRGDPRFQQILASLAPKD
jgi:TolB-like protein